LSTSFSLVSSLVLSTSFSLVSSVVLVNVGFFEKKLTVQDNPYNYFGQVVWPQPREVGIVEYVHFNQMATVEDAKIIYEHKERNTGTVSFYVR
jgi:hypothetical protein